MHIPHNGLLVRKTYNVAGKFVASLFLFQPLELREIDAKSTRPKATALGWWSEGDSSKLLKVAKGLEAGRSVVVVQAIYQGYQCIICAIKQKIATAVLVYSSCLPTLIQTKGQSPLDQEFIMKQTSV